MHFPRDQAGIQLIIDEFEREGFPQCYGLVDGTHVPVKVKASIKQRFTNRKKFTSVVMQGCTTLNGLFTNVNIGTPGSVHDSMIFRRSSLGQLLYENELLPNQPRDLNNDGVMIGLVLLADKAYQLSDFLMTPFKGDNLTPQQRLYNQIHKKVRRKIECTYGILKGRWRILLTPNLARMPNVINAIGTSVVLHNICVRLDDPVDLDWIPQDLDNFVFPQGAPQIGGQGVQTRNAFVIYFNT